MPQFNWERLSQEIGEEECQRLQPWLIAHYYLQRVMGFVWLGLLFSYVYTATDWLGGSHGAASSPDERQPLLGQILFIAFWASLLFNWILGRLLERRLKHLRDQHALRVPAPEAPPEAPPPAGEEAQAAEEDVAAGLGEDIGRLDEQWQWARDRVGEREWQALARLRNTWATLIAVRRYALLVTVYYALLVILEVAVKHRPLPDAMAWHPLQLAPFLAFACTGGVWLVAQAARRRLERLSWEGHNPELLQQALWTERTAQYLSDRRVQWERYQRDARAQAAARQQLEEEARAAPPLWRVELSGGHLVWWLSLLAVLIAAAHLPVPDRVWGPALAVVVTGGLIKLVFWILYANTTDMARIGRLRFYRWWSRGWLPVALALLPAAFVLWALLSGE